MADDILDNLANSSQLNKNKLYSVTFSHYEWHGLFWRLLRVGCALSDVASRHDVYHAQLWDKLSAELAQVMRNREIVTVL